MNLFPLKVIVPDRKDLRSRKVFNPDGTPYVGPLWSSSAVGAFESCERKWAWTAIANKPKVEKASQKLGTATHSEGENWLLKAIPPGKLLVESGALTHVPTPRGDGTGVYEGQVHTLQVEQPFGFVLDGMGFWGFKDLFFSNVTMDWKTTADLSWAKPKEVLGNDIQALVYSCHTLSLGFDTSRLKWVYVQTKGARLSLPVEVTMDRHDVISRLLTHRDSSTRMWDIKSLSKQSSDLDLTVKALPATRESCGEYGGCDFLKICSDMSPLNTLASLKRQENLANNHKENSMSMMDKIRAEVLAKRSAQGGTVQTIVQAPVSAPQTPPPTPTPAAAPIVQPQTSQTPSQPSGGSPLAAVAARMLAHTTTPSSAPVQQPVATGINPPDALPYNVAAQANAQVVTQPSQNGVSVAAVVQPVPEAAPKRRGRPAGIKNKSKEDSSVPVSAPPNMDMTADFHLYLDCLPVKGVQLLQVEDLIAPIRGQLESQAGKDGQSLPYRLIEFGKGPAVLAAELQVHLQENKPMGMYYAMSKTLDREVLDVIIRVADVVLKGTV